MKNETVTTMKFPIYLFKWSPNEHKVVRYECWGIEYGKIVKKPEQNVVVARGGIVRVGYEKNHITHGIDIKVMPGIVYNNVVWLPADNFGYACTLLRVKYLYALDDVRKKLHDIERIIDIIGEQEDKYKKEAEQHGG